MIRKEDSIFFTDQDKEKLSVKKIYYRRVN